MSHCVEQGLNERCQRLRGPGSSYDVMSRRSILGFWAQMKGLLVQAVTPDAVYIQPTPAGEHVPQSWHIRSQPQLWWVLKHDLTCSNRRGCTHIHTWARAHKNNKAHSCANTAKSLTITLLSILWDSEARLTDDTSERALAVCTCSLGACSGQRALINIWRETIHTVRYSLQDWDV